MANAPSSALPVQGVQNEMVKKMAQMKWNGLKDGPNGNEMAQDGPNKGEIINLEYARKNY